MKEETKAKKGEYCQRLIDLVENYPQILIVHADNVGSNQMQTIRKTLRGKAAVLMGKNTMIRRVLKLHAAKMPQLNNLLPLVKENVGFVFCKGDLTATRDTVLKNRVPAAAKVGTNAPQAVVVPAGPTGLDPSQTSFFQALNIATKINKGQIEIINDVPLIAAGAKVGSSEVALLQKLDIKPFTYGLTLRMVYDDGNVYDPEVLNLSTDVIAQKFFNGVANVAALSRAIGYPSAASFPHVLLDGFKNVVAAVLETGYTFKQAEALKNAKPAAAAPAAAAAAAPAAAAKPAAKKEEPKKVDDDEDGDFGFGGLF